MCVRFERIALKPHTLVTMGSNTRANKMDWDVWRRKNPIEKTQKRSNKLLNETQITDKKNELKNRIKETERKKKELERYGKEKRAPKENDECGWRKSGTRKVWNATWIQNNIIGIQLSEIVRSKHRCVWSMSVRGVGVCTASACAPSLFTNRSEIIEIEVIHCNAHTEMHLNQFFSKCVCVCVVFLSLVPLQLFQNF